MLVLSRKQGERLVVGDEITLTVTKCTRNRVVIGIDAPKEVPVKRGELVLELDDEAAEQPAAQSHSPAPLRGSESIQWPLPVSA